MVTARDEEDVLAKCLESLRNQTIKLFLVVVNDGSVDETGSIAAKYADAVVDLPRHEENWSGRPELARVFNAGFDALKQKDFKYVLISGADTVYPSYYAEEIIQRMGKGEISLASGVAEGEASRSLSPRGSGRVLNAEWFRRVGFRYPENFGFEVYVTYKALSEDRKVAVFPDLRFFLSRRTYMSREKSYLWGRGMSALNYWWLYALGRSFLSGIKHPALGLAMFNGYFCSTQPQYDDIKEFVNQFQRRMLKRRLREILWKPLLESKETAS